MCDSREKVTEMQSYTTRSPCTRETTAYGRAEASFVDGGIFVLLFSEYRLLCSSTMLHIIERKRAQGSKLFLLVRKGRRVRVRCMCAIVGGYLYGKGNRKHANILQSRFQF